MTGTSTPPPETLAQELNEFLLELALALQRFGMYPGGHPSVDAAVASLTARLDALLVAREVLSLGVARRQVILEGVASEASHPLLRTLAERLHRHRLGAVVFRRGVTELELRDALSAVAEDPDRSEPLGTSSPERLALWPHVGFYRVTYEQLQLAVSEPEGDDVEPSSGAAGQLWVGLAQAALARGEGRGNASGAGIDAGNGSARDAGMPASPKTSTDPADVARAINEHPTAQAYDQMIVGYMLQLAEELRRGGAGETAVRRRMSQMIRQLDAATLRRLLEMGGDMTQRGRFLHDAADSLRPDAVLELVRAAASAQQQDISTSMLRLLTKLSAFAGADGPGSARAEAAMRGQVRDLLEGWSLEDPNPDAYTSALDSMSRSSAGAAADEDDAAENAAEPLRIVQMALEVEAVGAAFWRAVDALLAEGRLQELMEVMSAAGTANTVADAVWRRLASADYIRRALTTDPVDFESLDRIFQRLPSATVISLLLDRISESTSRATRMGVFRQLSARGFAAIPHVMERLRDNRWFVQRNMLALLGEIGSWPAGFSPLQYANHGQATVRREALQLATRIPAERDEGICRALVDRDERTIRVGVNAAREHGLPANGVDALLQRLDEETLSPELRVAFIRLLSRHATPPVVARLTGMVVQERRLRGPKLQPVTPELVAAVASLARMRTRDPDAQRALELARSSSDAALRDAAGGTRR